MEPSAPPRGPLFIGSSTRAPLGAAAIYLLVSLALHGVTLQGRFVGDDFIWLHDADRLRGPLDLFALHQPTFAWHDGIRLSPVQLGFFSTAVHTFGVRVWPLALGALVAVALNAWLLHRWVTRLTGTDAAGWVSGLIFVTHPLHHEPNGWLSAVNEPLIGIGSMVALLALARAREGAGPWAARLMWAALLAALLTKASAVTLPLVLIAADVLLFSPVPFRDRLRLHLPGLALTALVMLWHVDAVRAARGPSYTFQPSNPPLTVAGGVVRYIAALLVGCDIAQALPPPLEQSASNQAWGVSALLGAAYLLACVESLVPAWRERQEGTPRRWGGVAFHLIWMALATLPYALAIPGAQLQSRYGWQGSMALAGLVGCAWPLLARSRASAIQWGAAVAVACTACAITLSGSVSRATLPDDTGSLISQAREATRERGPSGRLFVYQRASDQHAAGRAAALLTGTPDEHIRDWYEMATREGLAADDAALFVDPIARRFDNLTAAARRAIAAPRHLRPDAPVDTATGLPLVASWDLNRTRDRAAWRLEGATQAGDAPRFHVTRSEDTLSSPVLNLSPFDVFAVEIEMRNASGGGAAGNRFLGWSSPVEEGWGPRRFALPYNDNRDGRASVWFYPPTRDTWWIEGGARRFFISPSSLPADVIIERIRIWGPNPRDLPSR